MDFQQICYVHLYIVEICFGIAHWQVSSIFDTVICPPRNNVGVLSFHV